jgi:hypothetical protein
MLEIEVPLELCNTSLDRSSFLCRTDVTVRVGYMLDVVT